MRNSLKCEGFINVRIMETYKEKFSWLFFSWSLSHFSTIFLCVFDHTFQETLLAILLSNSFTIQLDYPCV